MEAQLEHILAMLGESNKGIIELKAVMHEMTAAKEDFDVWKPRVEQHVSNLQHTMSHLGTHVQKLIVNASMQSTKSK